MSRVCGGILLASSLVSFYVNDSQLPYSIIIIIIIIIIKNIAKAPIEQLVTKRCVMFCATIFFHFLFMQICDTILSYSLRKRLHIRILTRRTTIFSLTVTSSAGNFLKHHIICFLFSNFNLTLYCWILRLVIFY